MSVMPLSKLAKLPPLEPGDHLDQKTFHERYEAMPPGTRAELIGGIVYMPPPISDVHSDQHPFLITWLTWYAMLTPGTKVSDAPTIILADDSEPQPDAALRIVKGNTKSVRRKRTTYLAGPPELVAEVSVSSESIDLHEKRDDYEANGVKEYIAILTRTRRVAWFARKGRKLIEIQNDKDGVFRSRTFPGLWLDPTAILDGDMWRVQEVLNQGLGTPEHSAFVAELAEEGS